MTLGTIRYRLQVHHTFTHTIYTHTHLVEDINEYKILIYMLFIQLGCQFQFELSILPRLD